MEVNEYLQEYHAKDWKNLTTKKKKQQYLKEKDIKIQKDDEGVEGVAVKQGRKKMLQGKKVASATIKQEEYGNDEDRSHWSPCRNSIFNKAC